MTRFFLKTAVLSLVRLSTRLLQSQLSYGISERLSPVQRAHFLERQKAVAGIESILGKISKVSKIVQEMSVIDQLDELQAIDKLSA